LVVRGDSGGCVFTGVGEMVEPVFTRGNGDPTDLFEKASQLLHESARVLIGRVIDASEIVPSVASLLVDNPNRDQSVTIVNFAIEQAALVLISSARGQPISRSVAQYIGSNAVRESVTINGFINARVVDGDVAGLAGTVKVKVAGNRSPSDDAALINRIATISPGLRLRLDGNQGWGESEAIEFAEALSDKAVSQIEYFEEPLKPETGVLVGTQYRSLSELCTKWRLIPVALDESLLIIDDEVPGPLRIIHKTSLHGIRDSPHLRGNLDRVTITCTFESGFGLAFLICLAACLPQDTHGIHPLDSMLSDPVTARFKSITRVVNGIASVSVCDAEYLIQSIVSQY
jgi:hypothetical protein